MRSPAKPNPAGSIIDGSEIRGQGGELGSGAVVVNYLFYSGLQGLLGCSMDLKFDGLGGSLAGSICDGQGVGGCFLGRNIEAAGVRRPDCGYRRIQRDRFCVGDVVTKLRGLTAVDHARRDVKRADSEFGTAELLNRAEIVFAALLGLLLDSAFFKSAVGLVARDHHINDVSKDGHNHERGIVQAILAGRLLRRGRIGDHESLL